MTLQEMEAFAKTYDPSARIVLKDKSWLMWVIAVLAFVFNPKFMSTIAITIANRVYIPKAWIGRDLRRLIAHEVGGHVRQYRKCGLGIHPWAGLPIFWALYLFVLPFLFAFFRYRWELGAQLEACRWELTNGNSADYVRTLLADFIKRITGPIYLFAWVRPWALSRANKMYDKLLTEVPHNG